MSINRRHRSILHPVELSLHPFPLQVLFVDSFREGTTFELPGHSWLLVRIGISKKVDSPSAPCHGTSHHQLERHPHSVRLASRLARVEGPRSFHAQSTKPVLHIWCPRGNLCRHQLLLVLGRTSGQSSLSVVCALVQGSHLGQS